MDYIFFLLLKLTATKKKFYVEYTQRHLIFLNQIEQKKNLHLINVCFLFFKTFYLGNFYGIK